MSVRIAIDAMGGDLAPKALVDGAVKAATVNPDVQIILVGQPDKLPQEGSLPNNVTIEEAASVMAMDESAVPVRRWLRLCCFWGVFRVLLALVSVRCFPRLQAVRFCWILAPILRLMLNNICSLRF